MEYVETSDRLLVLVLADEGQASTAVSLCTLDNHDTLALEDGFEQFVLF
jgi:hypothetical protein